MEKIIHIEGKKRRDTIGLGYGVDDNFSQFDREVPTSSESEDDIQPTTIDLSHEEDFSYLERKYTI